MAHPYRLTETFKERLRLKQSRDVAKVLKAMKFLADNPHHPGLRTKRVEGTRSILEARVDRALRMTFAWDGPVIVLRNNCKHDEVLEHP